MAEMYAAYVELYYKQKGFSPVSSQPEEAKYIKWTVQAQIGMRSLSGIAESENLFNSNMPNASYVRREVLEILKIIELPPRPGLLRRGRPKGSRNKKTKQ